MSEILAGDSYGQMHACSISTKSVVHTYGQVTSNSQVSNLSFDFGFQDSFIFGSSSKVLRFYNLQQEESTNIEIQSNAKIIGTDVSNGVIYSYDDSSIAYISPSILKDTIEKEDIIYERDKLPKQSSFYKKGKLINDKDYVFVGFDIPPSLIDINKQSLYWSGKNVSNDYLDLHVPIRDVDVVTAQNASQITVLHEDRKLRVYDVRKQQKKPANSIDFNFDKYKFRKMLQSPCQNYLYIGGSQGSVFKVDKRKNYQLIYKLNGAKGAITSLGTSPDHSHLATGSLDGYLRVYNQENSSLVQKFYVGQPIHSLLFVESIDLQTLEQTNSNVIEKQKVPKRRNTVKLNYLEPRKILKLEQPKLQETVKDEYEQ